MKKVGLLLASLVIGLSLSAQTPQAKEEKTCCDKSKTEKCEKKEGEAKACCEKKEGEAKACCASEAKADATVKADATAKTDAKAKQSDKKSK